jgi:hypothetical protein
MPTAMGYRVVTAPRLGISRVDDSVLVQAGA